MMIFDHQLRSNRGLKNCSVVVLVLVQYGSIFVEIIPISSVFDIFQHMHGEIHP